jgi:hypothetical protein
MTIKIVYSSLSRNANHDQRLRRNKVKVKDHTIRISISNRCHPINTRRTLNIRSILNRIMAQE